ncbi:caspase family protein [Crocosphaera chwakensis]|uniref:Peptidase C14, caspase catalytic subunit p20 n=1 Tax=Crocosphaera chwakensis CCY0110 TaxID=391612 RepID=A3IKX1_9CHRO|nr:caspase family protein [Crocosphaera chwakensis]EAZ92840.1 Peptidase C14, caspase catalytic subunit p20 [Crocosphaera chwakensis CCY0110]
MNNFRAISIGIEDYLHYQPLTGSENSAQALYRYFFEEANIPPHQLLLLTDTSPSPGKRSTYPNRDNILQWINDSLIKVEYCWFFFQGYGINYQGEDYLLPIDSNLNSISQTAIKVRSLFDRLQSKSQNLLIILDLQNPLKDGKLGQMTLDIAQKKEISLIFSCRSHVYQSISAEKSILMSALTEALRYYSHHVTLHKLDSYLKERLSSSHQKNFPAIALPIIISPEKVRHQPLLPTAKKQVVNSQENRNLSFKIQEKFTQTSTKTPTSTLILPKLPQPPLKPQLSLNVPLTETKIKPSSPAVSSLPSVSSTSIKSTQTSQKSPIKKYLLWIGGILGATVVLWWMSLKIRQHLNTINYQKIQENQQILDYGKISLSVQQASQYNKAINYARQIQPHTALYQQAQDKINQWSQMILDIAQGRAIIGDFQGAIAAVKLVPPDNPKLYELAQQSLKEWQHLSQKQQDNQVLIEVALSLIKPNQASSYNRAIRLLKHLDKKELGYHHARKLIEQLSKNIYQLAQTRAKEGQLILAIETIELVPNDTQVYPIAQEAKINWQQRLNRSSN